MFKFTRTGVFCILTAILFFIIQIFINQYKIQSEIDEEIMNMQILKEMPVMEAKEISKIWYIEISKISLNANISEGITKEVLNQYVGHFENTSKQEGNIVLAAYNRSRDVNYFKDLKLLQKGDEIKYKYNEYEKIYEIEKCRIIKDTECQYLEETDENILTLITFIENHPEYRRCIRAVEKDMDE